MRQRVTIALAIACSPALLLADEPTTALDLTIQDQILSLLAELQDNLGMAILLVSHDRDVLAQCADRVLTMGGGRVLDGGRAIEAGRAANVGVVLDGDRAVDAGRAADAGVVLDGGRAADTGRAADAGGVVNVSG